MPTPRQRWPAAANAARQLAMRNQERIAQITRELLRDSRIAHDNGLARLVYEAQALAEQARRELGEAKPYPEDEAPHAEPGEAPSGQ
jgi:cell division protein FtsB